MHPQFKFEIDLGDLNKGEEKIFNIEFENDFGVGYKIRKITPFCACIKVLNHSDTHVFSQVVMRQHQHEEMSLKDIDETEDTDFPTPTKFEIKCSIKKSYLGKSSTDMDIVFESLWDVERFGLITVKYNVISK